MIFLDFQFFLPFQNIKHRHVRTKPYYSFFMYAGVPVNSILSDKKSLFTNDWDATETPLSNLIAPIIMAPEPTYSPFPMIFPAPPIQMEVCNTQQFPIVLSLLTTIVP